MLKFHGTMPFELEILARLFNVHLFCVLGCLSNSELVIVILITTVSVAQCAAPNAARALRSHRTQWDYCRVTKGIVEGLLAVVLFVIVGLQSVN